MNDLVKGVLAALIANMVWAKYNKELSSLLGESND